MSMLHHSIKWIIARYVQTRWRAPSQINVYILDVHVRTERMAATLQHYLTLCFYFSHVSLGERSPQTSQRDKLIPLWFWFSLPVPADALVSAAQQHHHHFKLFASSHMLPKARELRGAPRKWLFACWPGQYDARVKAISDHSSPCTTQQLTIRQ